MGNAAMTYEEMQKEISDILEKYDPVYIYTSQDFQCDQTEGFPTCLCVCFEKGKAWLELNENLLMDRDAMEMDYYRQLCADFGIRTCWDKEQFNALLKELGEDACRTAYLPNEGEDMGMGGI